MKILVTGAAGFLGSAVVERLLAHGYEDIRCFIRPGSRRERLEALQRQYPQANIELFAGNLLSPADAAYAVGGVSVVYHLVAALRGSTADIVLNTVVTSKYLLEAIGGRKPMRILLVSSFGVYGVSDLPSGALVDENTPLETHPARRDPYSFAKIRQERLFREYQRKHGFELTIVRPGVVYGPRGSRMSARVGFSMFGLFVHCGRRNLLPLTYVDNCAEAIVIAAERPETAGEVFNIVDDDLPTAGAYLKAYKRQVGGIRSITVPYLGVLALAKMIEKYHTFSKGQLPAALTAYKVGVLWKGNRFQQPEA